MKLGVVAIAMVALASTGARPAAAQQTTHGCACLHNQTQVPISYRSKWGEGEWKTMKLQAGYRNWICWQYQNAQKSSPNLLFQLDVDMSKGSAWTTYTIGRVQTAGASCDAVGAGGHYNVSYRPNTNNGFIQVTKRN